MCWLVCSFGWLFSQMCFEESVIVLCCYRWTGLAQEPEEDSWVECNNPETGRQEHVVGWWTKWTGMWALCHQIGEARNCRADEERSLQACGKCAFSIHWDCLLGHLGWLFTPELLSNLSKVISGRKSQWKSLAGFCVTAFLPWPSQEFRSIQHYTVM